MIWIARLREGYTNHVLWISHHKSPAGAVRAITKHNGAPIDWEEGWMEYLKKGWRKESTNHGNDYYEIVTYNLLP